MEKPPAEVQDVERTGGLLVEHVGDALNVGELEVRRVVGIDVGVPQPVEDERPPALPLWVGVQNDRDAHRGRVQRTQLAADHHLSVRQRRARRHPLQLSMLSRGHS